MYIYTDPAFNYHYRNANVTFMICYHDFWQSLYQRLALKLPARVSRKEDENKT